MVKGIGHAAFNVKDMEKTVAFYEQTLGFKRAFDIPRPENGEPWIVYLYGGGGTVHRAVLRRDQGESVPRREHRVLPHLLRGRGHSRSLEEGCRNRSAAGRRAEAGRGFQLAVLDARPGRN